MDFAYGLHYRELYKKHWWWRARENLILSTIERMRPAGNWGSILDVGCGDGLLFEHLSRFGDVEGIETNATLVTKGGPFENKIHVGSLDDTFRPGKHYSLILMLDVLEHFIDPVSCLRRALDLLDSGGVLIITVPAFQSLWTAHDELNHHFTRYTKTSLTRLTTNAGMRIYSSRYFFQWTFPVKLLIHVKERLLDTSPKVPRVPPRWFNETAYQLSCLEQKVFGALPVPFGSSLIVVGGRR